MLSNVSMVMLLAKATVILLAALGITIVMQRASAGARHLVWLVTLGTLLIVPALAAWSPLRLEILPPVEEKIVAPVPDASAALANTVAQETAPLANPAPAASYTPAENSTSFFSSLTSLRGLSLVIAVWGAVVLLLGAWLAWSAFAVKRIVRRAHPLDTQDWLVPLWEIADRLELEEPPRLLGSSDAKMPFACGFIKPTIVLPADCENWTLDRRRAVLLHELAHVKRHDLLGHTLGRLTCAVYWFHPLVWTAAKQLRSESERACDDLALSCGAKASDYAEHLLDIVTSVKGDATPAVALAMARRKEFEGRMLAILDPELRHSTPNRRQAAGLVASLALIAVVVGAAAPAPRPAVVVASSVPVTTETPKIRSDFVPKDEPAEVAAPHGSPAREPVAPVEKTEKEVKHATEKVFSPVASAITNTIANVVVESATKAATGSVSSLMEGATGRTLDIGKVRVDERPALLANILRTDKDPSLRRVAAWGLSEHAHMPVAMEALIYALRQDSDVGVREMAAWALGDARDNSPAITALMTALKSDADPTVRGISAWALGQIGDPDAVGALVAALADPGKGVRVRAAWAIGSCEPKEAPAQLVALLKDPQPAVRQLTAWALYQIEDPSTVPALQSALERETNDALKLNYIQALAALGEKSVDAVRPMLTSTDPKIRSMAIRALAGGRGAGPWPWPWPEPRPHP